MAGFKIKGYVARDENGSLWFHFTKPHRENDIEKTWWGSNDKSFEIYDFDFPEYADLNWEESEPVEVELTLRRVNEEEVNRTHRVSQPEKLGTGNNKK